MVFSGRNAKELLRDPLNIAFALGFPIVVMLLLTAIQANIPTAVFPIQTIAPGMAVFGLSFISLFSGTLIARDRATSFMMRLFASPMGAIHFILGYTLPLLPLALCQSALCYGVAFFLGLPVTIHVMLALLALVPMAVFFIAIGLLAGTLLTDKQVGGICGALLTNLSAWFSGAWFNLSLVGGLFESIAYCLPFAHGVDAGRAAFLGDYSSIPMHLVWVTGYAICTMIVAIWAFRRKMRRDNQ
ncbi:ABC transporter permease [Eubacteriales bacterium OttesenSCG-928-M02]|nr:ABC transporter permease [Eubacteriales bacterium OttesenSCG-928-M02]